MVLDLGTCGALEGYPLALRLLEDADASALANLMLAAYRGTVDDHGEGPEDASSKTRQPERLCYRRR